MPGAVFLPVGTEAGQIPGLDVATALDFDGRRRHPLPDSFDRFPFSRLLARSAGLL